MPNGTVTPGPIAWQMHFRRDAAPSVSPPPAGNTSGYVYAQKSNENIVIPPGSPVTIQLTSSPPYRRPYGNQCTHETAEHDVHHAGPLALAAFLGVGARRARRRVRLRFTTVP